MSKLKDYENAFHEFRSATVPAYELFRANIAARELFKELIADGMSNGLADNALYHLIQEDSYKQHMLNEFPELKGSIARYLECAPELRKEEKLMKERITSFPFCGTAIKVLKKNGLKIREGCEEGLLGYYSSNTHEIHIKSGLKYPMQIQTLLHESLHAFYQQPLLNSNQLIEQIIDEQTFYHLKYNKRIIPMLDNMLDSSDFIKPMSKN